MKKIFANLPRGPYPVWVGEKILDRAALALKSLDARKAFVVSDIRLQTQAKKLISSLRQIGWRVGVCWVEGTEDFKSFRQIYPLYGYLLRQGADRHSVLFAVGGGVVGDAVGFLAGTFLRGIRWVGVPTTLLAQVDSCVGGKTGLNHELGKNLIGIFHQPSGVICELSFLKTLQPRDLVSGLGEMIKYGLIFDSSLFLDLESHWNDVVTLESGRDLERWIHRCLRHKIRVVAKDEFDARGIREALNFGHTLAHALEAETGYGHLRHGEAVILGMRVATCLSVLRGHLNETVYLKVDSFLSSLPVPAVPERLKTQNLVARLKWDKKAREGKTRFVLLEKVGKVVLDSKVSTSEVTQAVDWVRGRS